MYQHHLTRKFTSNPDLRERSFYYAMLDIADRSRPRKEVVKRLDNHALGVLNATGRYVLNASANVRDVYIRTTLCL